MAAVLESASVEQDPMALLMAQHYACVLHLQSLKAAGQVHGAARGGLGVEPHFKLIIHF